MIKLSKKLIRKKIVSEGFADMVNMEIINDAELMVNLSVRYLKGLIFTYVGPTLLALNPFKEVPGLIDET